jgi:hypothetical protein
MAAAAETAAAETAADETAADETAAAETAAGTAAAGTAAAGTAPMRVDVPRAATLGATAGATGLQTRARLPGWRTGTRAPPPLKSRRPRPFKDASRRSRAEKARSRRLVHPPNVTIETAAGAATETRSGTGCVRAGDDGTRTAS